MKAVTKEDVPALPSKHGEIIYELIGKGIDNHTDLHSVAYVVIPPAKSSLLHYHPVA